MSPKQRAAEAAVEFVKTGMVVGLGTGTTADCFLVALAARLRDRRLGQIVGVPTSLQSERRARELGIPVGTLAEHPQPDITIDGADEVDPQLDAIKGLGGALLREKIVAQASRRLVIIADSTKQSARLGTRSPLPVEVCTFAHEPQQRFLASLGCSATLRLTPAGEPYQTDNGNFIYDCRFAGIADPAALQAQLKNRAGIVESGLFLGIVQTLVVADETRVWTRSR
jgi:ribose 5-phosphate isomerase A